MPKNNFFNRIVFSFSLTLISVFLTSCQSEYSGQKVPLKIDQIEHAFYAEGLSEIETKSLARLIGRASLLPSTSQSFQIAKEDSVEVTATLKGAEQEKVTVKARYCRIGYLVAKELGQKVGVFFKDNDQKNQVNCSSLEYKWMDPNVPRASAAQAQMALMEELHFYISLFTNDESEEAKNLWKSIPSQLAFVGSDIQVIPPEQVSVGVKYLYTSELVLKSSVQLLVESSKGITFAQDQGVKAWVAALKIWRGNLANLNTEEFEPGLIEGVEL